MIKKINSIVFIVIILGASLLFLTLPKQDKSYSEKRKLAEIPEFNYFNYVKGIWAQKIDAYIDDHFPFRKNMIDIADVVQTFKGVHLKKQEKIFVAQRPKKQKKVLDSDSNHTKMNYLDDFEQSYSGSMLIINGCVYPMGGGSPVMSKSFSKMVSEYARELKGETRVITAVAPLSSAFIPVKKYYKYNKQNKETLEAIGTHLTDGAIFSDVFKEMNVHAGEKMYFSTDHHWKPIGAYYAYVAFCKAAGFEPVSLKKMEKRVKYNFIGTLYNHTRDLSVKENPDTMEYFVPRVNATAVQYPKAGFKRPMKSHVFYHDASGGNTYSTFIAGDHPLMKITTDVKNGKKAVVIKNSYGNAFVVYLISHYEEVWVVDFRYSQHNLVSLIRDNKINDLIFGLGMYGTMSGQAISMMRNLGKQSGEFVPEKSTKKEKSRESDTLRKSKDAKPSKSTSTESTDSSLILN